MNLPMGCKDNDYDPPTNYSAGYECSVCLHAGIDPYDLELHHVDGELVCQDCCATCDLCGEYIDDDTTERGPEVHFRRWEMDGKLSDAYHALCGAENLLGSMREHVVGDGDYSFDSSEFTKDDIAAIVEDAQQRTSEFVRAWEA